MSRRLTTALSATAPRLRARPERLRRGGGHQAVPGGQRVTVTGSDPAKAPTVTVKAPLTVTKTGSQVVTDGTGAAVAKDDLVSIQAVIVNGRDGKVVNSTLGDRRRGPRPRRGRELFKSFKSELPGKKVGSRVVITSTAADAFGDTGNESSASRRTTRSSSSSTSSRPPSPSTEAEGKAVAPKAGLPTVTMNEGKPATITVPKGAKAPTKTIVQPLIEGTGPEVKKGQTVRVAYTGALLKDGSVFDSSANHPEQPYFDFPIGQGQVIKGWDNGLEGENVGSRVLLVIPPAEGYGTAGSPPKISGNDTLVFVVDILAAY